MSQQIEYLLQKPYDLCLIPGTHTGRREQTHLWYKFACAYTLISYIYTLTQLKLNKSLRKLII